MVLCALVLQAEKQSEEGGTGGCSSASGPSSRETETGGREEAERTGGRGEEAAGEGADRGEDEE